MIRFVLSLPAGRVVALSALCLLPVTVVAGLLRVTGDNVNLRSAAGERFEVVGQVSSGRELRVLGDPDQEWVEVVPPEEVDLWIFSDLVEDGRVIVRLAQVRAGAGLNYQVVGRVERDGAVNVRGRLGDWLRIAPPPGSALWISRRYVEPVATVPASVARPEAPPPPPPLESEPDLPGLAIVPPPPVAVPPPAPRPPEKVEKPVPPATAPESFPRAGQRAGHEREIPRAVSRFSLVPEQRQGQPGRFTGVLRRSGWVFRRPSRYRLVAYDRSGRAVTKCYVISARAQLDQLIGCRVELEGGIYWIAGVGYPTVAVDRLVRLE